MKINANDYRANEIIKIIREWSEHPNAQTVDYVNLEKKLTEQKMLFNFMNMDKEIMILNFC